MITFAVLTISDSAITVYLTYDSFPAPQFASMLDNSAGPSPPPMLSRTIKP